MRSGARLHKLFIATTVSMTGSQLSLVAIPIFVLRSGGPGRLATIVALEMCCAVLGSVGLIRAMSHLDAGVRMIVADTTRGLVCLVVVALDRNLHSFLAPLAVLATVACFSPTYSGAARELLASEVSQETVVKRSIAAKYQLAIRGAQLAGYSLAAALAFIGFTWQLIVLDALSYFVSASLLGSKRGRTAAGSSRMPKSSLLIGFRVAKTLTPISLAEGSMQSLFVLLPLLALTISSSVAFAVWMLGLAVGTAAGLWVMRFIDVHTRISGATLAACGISTIGLTQAKHGIWVPFLVLCVIGMASSIASASAFARLADRANAQAVGAAYSSLSVMSLGFGAVNAYITGALTVHFSPIVATYELAAVLLLFAALAAAIDRSVTQTSLAT